MGMLLVATLDLRPTGSKVQFILPAGACSSFLFGWFLSSILVNRNFFSSATTPEYNPRKPVAWLELHPDRLLNALQTKANIPVARGNLHGYWLRFSGE